MLPEEVIKLLLSALVGGLIGFEREYRLGFGLRTLTLVCLGSTLFTMYSDMISPTLGDPRRISAAVVSGVGFLGAGVILKEQGRILGLTTAAAIWVVAAIGMGIGAGFYPLALTGAGLTFGVLWGVPRVTQRFQERYTVVYRATCLRESADFKALTQRFHDARLRVNRSSLEKSGGQAVFSWHVYGDPDRHEAVERLFVEDPSVLEFAVLQ
jgi:putative Mg2+ transporter-C (MgtC) family protein